MSFTNFDTKEINCKIIYFGPPGVGKTANLRALYKQTAEELQSGLVEMSAAIPRTQFFDFLPMSLGRVQDFHLKLHLFSLPLTPLYETVQSVVLKGLDGFIFVADSRVERLASNINYLNDLRRLLSEEGFNLTDLPRVIQYNRRDEPRAVPVEILKRELNPGGDPDQEAIATESTGTLETLQMMAKQVLYRLSHTTSSKDTFAGK